MKTKSFPTHNLDFKINIPPSIRYTALTDSIAYSLENKSYCSAILLDVAQAFDRVWHPGFLHKLKKILPPSYYLFFKSYLEDRFFATKNGSEISNLALILAGVPQGAISSPILFNIYTADQSTTSHFGSRLR